MIKIICDGCQAELEGSHLIPAVAAIRDNSQELSAYRDGIQLCGQCANRLLSKPCEVWLAFLNDNSIPKEEKKTDHKRTIDLDEGKILALHNAGWPQVKIAAEFGVSQAVISKRLKKLKKLKGGVQ